MKSKKAEEFNPNTEKNRQLLMSAIQGDGKACKKLKYIIFRKYGKQESRKRV